MTRAFALLLVVVGACEQGGSVELTLTQPDGLEVARVELYAALGDEREAMVRPALFPGPISTQWWARDMRDTEHDVERMTDGSATFVYGRGGDEWLEGFVAVGFDLQDQPIAMTARLKSTQIPVNEVHQYTLPMTAFDSLPRYGKPITNPGLQLWGPSTNPRACVQVDQVDGIGADQATALIAHADNDLDCDGYTDGSPEECVDREYMSRRPFESLDDLHCAQKVDLPPTAQGSTLLGCVAGGGACIDGLGDDPRCYRSSYCMNAKFCEACTALACTTPPPETAVTRVVCTWPYRQESSGAYSFCSGSPTFSLRGIAADLVCNTPMLIRDQRVGGWTPVLNVGLAANFFVETSDLGTCEFKLIASGTVPTGANNTPRGEFGAYLGVGLGAPIKGRGLILSFKLGGVTANGCSTAPTCHVEKVAGDTLNECVHSEVEPGTTIVPPP